MSFIDMLPPEVHAHLRRCEDYGASRKEAFRGLTDENLAASARFFMQHCVRPGRIDPDAPTYDATMWHAIIPEMIRRLGEK